MIAGGGFLEAPLPRMRLVGESRGRVKARGCDGRNARKKLLIALSSPGHAIRAPGISNYGFRMESPFPSLAGSNHTLFFDRKKGRHDPMRHFCARHGGTPQFRAGFRLIHRNSGGIRRQRAKALLGLTAQSWSLIGRMTALGLKP
jgi:hypothetical protein